MNRLNGMWLKGLVWMVAIMLPVQPLAASHCSCGHFAEYAVVAGEDADADRLGCRSGKCGCSSKQRTPESDSKAKVPFAPCECPANCPCHLQHAPKLAVKTQDVQVEKCESVAVFVAPRQSLVLPQEYRRTRLNSEHGAILSETALELCAALCRFTI